MPVMLITYVPRGRASYRLPQLISSLGENWSPTYSVWLLKTSLSTTALFARLKGSVSASDNLIILELGKRYSTNLPEGEKEWLYKHLR